MISDTPLKVSKYGAFSGPYFPVFGLNMGIYFVNLRIMSKYSKTWTRKSTVFGHFSRSGIAHKPQNSSRSGVS